MLIKLLFTAGIIYLIYVIFFKKTALKSNRTSAPKQDKNQESNEMVACATCDTYALIEDMIISDGKYYCSKTCLEQKS